MLGGKFEECSMLLVTCSIKMWNIYLTLPYMHYNYDPWSF